METSPTNFRQAYRDLLLQFLWRQWSALGVSGYAKSGAPWAVDPEALLLFSTDIARYDPRLFDEILDWLQNNADNLSLQRLTRMQKDYRFGNPTVLSAIASRLCQNSAHNKWKVLAQGSLTKRIEKPTTAPQPLFPTAGHISEADPDFLEWGWQRSPVRYRGLSVRRSPDQPATFLLKLRSLFGRQSRAEVIAWLLANESGHPAEIARQTGYFPRSVQLTLNELEQSGHIRSLRYGREKHFSIIHEEWRFLATWRKQSNMPHGFPQWIVWPARFEALDRVHLTLSDPEWENRSIHMQAIQLRKALDFSALTRAGLPTHFNPNEQLGGQDFLSDALQQVQALLDPIASND
jgi:hypothetical protein